LWLCKDLLPFSLVSSNPAQTHSETLKKYIHDAGSTRFEIIKVLADKYMIRQHVEITNTQVEMQIKNDPAQKARYDYLESEFPSVRKTTLVTEFSLFDSKARTYDLRVDVSKFWVANKLELPVLFALARLIFWFSVEETFLLRVLSWCRKEHR
jgi:hypothetical protein